MTALTPTALVCAAPIFTLGQISPTLLPVQLNPASPIMTVVSIGKRAILIDPKAQTITEVSSGIGLSYSDIHGLVQDQAGLSSFSIVNNDCGWEDINGPVDGKPVYGFLLSTNPDPIVSRCLVTVVDSGGNVQSAKISVADLTSDVTWLGEVTPILTWDENEQAIVAYDVQKVAGSAMTLPARFQGSGRYTIAGV